MNHRVHQPVFIVGCGRSGTTLLFDLLKAHPGLAPTTGHPDGEDHVGWITHGKAVIAGLYGNESDAGSVVGHTCCLHMTANDVTDEIRESMHRYYWQEVLSERPDLRVLNKCPHISNKIGYVKAIFPDAKFIHVVLDPAAMVASWVNIMALVPDLAVYWPDDAFPCLWVLDRKTLPPSTLDRNRRIYPGGGLHALADYWTAVNLGVLRQADHAAAQLLTVRYEDLVSAPLATVARITEFCGVPRMNRLAVEINTNRNAARPSALTGEDRLEIRERTRAGAEHFGYPTASALPA